MNIKPFSDDFGALRAENPQYAAQIKEIEPTLTLLAKRGLRSLGGQTLNPYDLARSPGGSSSRSATAIGANLVAIGIGSVVGGSIRIPASFQNIVGVKTSIGLVSRQGAFYSMPTRSVLGPMSRTVTDSAILLDFLVGFDPEDPYTSASVGQLPTTYTRFLTEDALQGARIAVLASPFGAGSQRTRASRDIQAVIDDASQSMADLEAVVVEGVDLNPTSQ